MLEELDAPHPPPLTRAEAITRLQEFEQEALLDYPLLRNFDFGPERHTSVSRLSAALAHRTISERSVLAALKQPPPEKFEQELLWATYWRSYLELNPGIWSDFTSFRYTERSVSPPITGIRCFDFWAEELLETGYLHNHARMWFASIWVHTLKWDWRDGARFFLNYLYDGDPATNTLSWRWVAGLHTRGKAYLAESRNIRRFTGSRFESTPELALSASKQEDTSKDFPADLSKPKTEPLESVETDCLWVLPSDLEVEVGELSRLQFREIGVDFEIKSMIANSSKRLKASRETTLEDQCTRLEAHFGIKIARIKDKESRARFLSKSSPLAFLPPVGPVRDQLNGPEYAQVKWIEREWTKILRPGARAGFFQFWKHYRQKVTRFFPQSFGA